MNPKSLKNSRRIYNFCFSLLASMTLAPAMLHAADTFPMPSTGTCSFLINLPIPYGVNPGQSGYTTGGSVMGRITFTSATTGTLVGAVVNPTYKSDGSPDIYARHNIYINDGVFTITSLTQANGFEGGYLMKVSGTAIKDIGQTPIFQPLFEANVLPVNSGKTIFMQFTDSGTTGDAGAGPGTGVCQF